MANLVVKVLKSLIVRTYALVILLLVAWTGYTAVAYLFRSVFRPVHVPREFLDWQGHLDADMLHTEQVPGITEPAMRSPLNHYHRVDRWFQPDPQNGCTTSGCHSALPHNRHKEIRAFANLHGTFLSCQMCHDKNATSPAKAMWVSTTTGERQDPPATLQLMRQLETNADRINKKPGDLHPVIVGLLRQALKVIGPDPVLDYLLVRLDTSEPGSPVWRHALSQLEAELPAHTRGEYAAKLTLLKSEDEQRKAAEQIEEQTRQFLSAPGQIEERKAIAKRIHANINPEPAGCLACHGGEPRLLDFESLGYSPKRSASLANESIAKLMQRIRQGQPFYLPRLLEMENAPAR